MMPGMGAVIAAKASAGLAKAAPWLIGIAALAGLLVLTDCRAEKRGVMKERAEWSERVKRLTDAASHLSVTARLAIKDAEIKAANASAKIVVVKDEIRTEREKYYATPGVDNGIAYDAGRVRAIEDGLRAGAAAARAGRNAGTGGADRGNPSAPEK